MLNFPNCKINLGLHITRKRDDGFHDLETVFYPVYHLHDALEIQRRDSSKTIDDSNPDAISFQLTGLPVDGDASNNLCTKAYHLLKQDYPELAPINMHLHKAIPMGAGLGGGSADGAFTLKLLNEKFQLKLSPYQLINYALQLGSDCPFFINNKPCFAWSRGEMMEDIKLDLSNYSIVIINPGVHVNTGWAFGQITPQQPAADLKELIAQPIETWKGSVVNDFEAAVIHTHPVIGSIKNSLYNNGAKYASMSGSGSTVFGIFSKDTLPSSKLYPDFLELHLAL